MKAILQQLQKKHIFLEEVKKQKRTKAVSNKVDQILRGCDMYGTGFNVLFDGKSSYKTAFGGLVSVLVTMAIITYAIYKFSLLINYYDFLYSSHQEIINVSDLNFDLNYDKFPLIVSLNKNLTDDYGYLVMRQSFQQQSIDPSTGQAQWQEATTMISYEECSNYIFENYWDKGSVTYCSQKNETYSIGGALSNEQLNSRIFIEIYKCKGKSLSGQACKNDTEINKFLSKLQIIVPIKVNYLDLDNFTDPIKEYFNTDNVFSLLPSTSMNALVFLQLNEIELKDGRFFEEPNYYVIIETERTVTFSSTLEDDDLVFKMQINLDYYQTKYTRKVYSTTDFLSEIGGLKTSIFAIGLLFTNYINDRLKNASLIKRVYQFKSSDKSRGQKSKNQRKRLNAAVKYKKEKNTDGSISTRVNQNIIEVDNEKMDETYKLLEIGLNQYNKRENFKQEYTMFNKIKMYFDSVINIRKRKIDAADFITTYKKYIIEFLTERELFNIKTFDLVKYIFKCWICKSYKNLKKDKRLKKYYYLKKGTEKLEKEFDIVEILRTIRQVKLLRNIFMNDYQRMLFRYQRDNLIESDSHSSENDDDILDNFSVQQFKHRNMGIKSYVDDLVKDSINYFTKKSNDLSLLDQRLIAGLMVKKMNYQNINQGNRNHQKKKKAIDRYQTINTQRGLDANGCGDVILMLDSNERNDSFHDDAGASQAPYQLTKKNQNKFTTKNQLRYGI